VLKSRYLSFRMLLASKPSEETTVDEEMSRAHCASQPKTFAQLHQFYVTFTTPTTPFSIYVQRAPLVLIPFFLYSNLRRSKAQNNQNFPRRSRSRATSELCREVRRALRRPSRLRPRWLVNVLEVVPHVEPLAGRRSIVVAQRGNVRRPRQLR
jgi:hypothetical protein